MDLEGNFDAAEVGRRLGHDYYSLSQLTMQSDWPASVQEGFEEASARRKHRPGADRFHRKWLQLRLGALRRNREVAANVTPQLLRRLDVSHCPVTREPLTHGQRTDTDWSVDRLNNDGAYASGNLAIMSARANRAKSSFTFDQALDFASRETRVRELDAPEWLRMAVLMEGPTFATRPHSAPMLPLVAPLPCGSLRLAVQQIQRLFTLVASRSSDRNALVKQLNVAAVSERSRNRLRWLADAVHQGLKQLGPDDQCWDVWLRPEAMGALGDWKASLDERAWATSARISAHIAGADRVTPSVLQAWQLARRGYTAGRQGQLQTH